MKKKLLSFVLAICLIVPCAFALTACGSNPPDDPAHTHNWATTWSKNSTEHWKTCDNCNEKKDKASHDGDTCSVCGYVKGIDPNPSIPTVASVRDLEVITMATADGGYVTLVKLPDGKNMVLGAGADTFSSELSMDGLLMNDNGVTTIDYFVLTGVADLRIGGADSIFDYYEVKEFYYPTFGTSITASSSYNLSLEKAQSENACISKTIAENNCDIDYSFKDEQNNIHNYKIDFMLPIDFAEATNERDISVVVSIEYQNKKILVTGDATVANIDGYCSKFGATKNVDVLITFYTPGEVNAIAGSANRGTNYLDKIGLAEGDYCVIGINNGSSDVPNLYSKVGYLGNNVYTLNSSTITTSTAKISTSGVVNVTAE